MERECLVEGGEDATFPLGGDDERDDGWLDGKDVPTSLGGNKSKTPVGTRMKAERNPGLFANSVMESRRGSTSMNISVRNGVDFVGGNRVRSAECKAIDD